MAKKKKEQIMLVGPQDYFDDCPICRAMKKTEEQNKNLTESEIKEAFKAAKKQSEESDKN